MDPQAVAKLVDKAAEAGDLTPLQRALATKSLPVQDRKVCRHHAALMLVQDQSHRRVTQRIAQAALFTAAGRGHTNMCDWLLLHGGARALVASEVRHLLARMHQAGDVH